MHWKLKFSSWPVRDTLLLTTEKGFFHGHPGTWLLRAHLHGCSTEVLVRRTYVIKTGRGSFTVTVWLFAPDSSCKWLRIYTCNFLYLLYGRILVRQKTLSIVLNWKSSSIVSDSQLLRQRFLGFLWKGTQNVNTTVTQREAGAFSRYHLNRSITFAFLCEFINRFANHNWYKQWYHGHGLWMIQYFFKKHHGQSGVNRVPPWAEHSTPSRPHHEKCWYWYTPSHLRLYWCKWFSCCKQIQA